MEAPAARASGAAPRRVVAFIGHPNTGKSTLFNRLTGAGAKVGNWPGMTVDLTQARILLGADMVTVADLPGAYSLDGYAEDEARVRDFLSTQSVAAVVAVLNAAQIERQLPLALAIAAAGLPSVVVLNMEDEATRLGIRVDTEALSRALGAPVVLVSARSGRGVEELRNALRQAIGAPARANLAAIPAREAREREAARIARTSVSIPATLPRQITDRLDHWLLHRWLGLPLFFAVMLGLFQLVYGLGVPLQDALDALIAYGKHQWLEPALATASQPWRSFLLDGLVDGLGTVLVFLPVIVVFFAVMALVEDSGYLARAAFLVDGLMARLGLDGRAFAMHMMGFGCNVPAILGTRVIRDPLARRLAMLAIPFSLCSARLQVFVFIATAIFSPRAAPWVLLGFYLASFAAALVTALVWRGRYRGTEPLLMEIPPLRRPLLRQVAAEAWRATKHFLRGAAGFIVAGVVLVWLLTHLPAAGASHAETFARWLSPVFSPLGIDAQLSVALLFGFVAKEIVLGGMAVILAAGQDELALTLARQLDWVEAMSFMLFTLLYTPCLPALAALGREARSARFALRSVAWSFGLAWLASFVFYQGARLLGF